MKGLRCRMLVDFGCIFFQSLPIPNSKTIFKINNTPLSTLPQSLNLDFIEKELSFKIHMNSLM